MSSHGSSYPKIVPSSRFSNHRFHREPAWQMLRRVAVSQAPYEWRHWLLDRGSLTERLLAKSNGQLRVRVLSQQLETPRLSECRRLHMHSRSLAMVREVILYGRDQPWVYARSILPLTTLTGRLRCLRKLDNRPLGQLLFNDPSMHRDPIETACLTRGNCDLPPAMGVFDRPLWGRRSVFRLDDKPMLVSEIFLPTFSPFNCPAPNLY